MKKRRFMDALRGLRAVVSHPVFLLLLGGALTGYLIPSFTQRWQDHQNELDVKSRLVTQVSEGLATFTGSVRRIALGGGQPGLRGLDSAYVTYDVRYAVVRSELEAYFPHNQKLLDAWDKVSNGVSGDYYLLKNDTHESRRSTFDDWSQWIGPYRESESAALVKYSLRHIPKDALAEYDRDLFGLFQHIWNNQETIVRMILSARSAV
jgi:hypothetical protein